MTATGNLRQLRSTGPIGQPPGTAQLEAPSIRRVKGMLPLLTPPPSVDELDITTGMVEEILLRLAYNEGEVGATHAEEVLKTALSGYGYYVGSYAARALHRGG